MIQNRGVEKKLIRKSRVATLEQLLKEQEQKRVNQTNYLEVALHNQHQQTDLLHALVSATDPSHGEDIFNALVYHLATALKVPCAIAGEFQTDQATGYGETIAVWANNTWAPNFSFDLGVLHSAQLIQERNIFSFAVGPQSIPEMMKLKQEGMEHYFAIPIYGRSSVPIGLLAILDTNPLQFSPEVQSLLKLFASRAGAELERVRLERCLLRERIKRIMPDGEEQYRVLLGQTDVGMAQLETSSGRFVHINRRHCEIAGRTESQMLASTFMDITHPDDLQPDLDNMQRLIAGDIRSFEMEKRYVCLDGSLKWVHLTVLPTWKPGQKPKNHLAVIKDISVRKQMEKSLRQSEQLFNSLIEAIPQQVWTALPDGTLDYVNRRVLDYFNCQRSDLLGWGWQSLLHPDDLPACMTAWRNALNTGEPYEIHFRLRRACDGAYRWHLARALPVKDDSNQVIKWFGTNTDISKHKQMEDELRWREADLRVAIDEREQISQDLHDHILQSLYAVGMHIETGKLLIRKSPQKAKGHITHSIDLLNRQVHEIRQFITMLKQPTTSKPNFGKALKQLVESFSVDGQGSPTLEIDEPRLLSMTATQAEHLLNIAREALSNSMRHAQATHRSVRLSHARNRFQIVIYDDGKGFSAGQRGPHSHGLANMSARAKKIHAHLTIDSAPGKGTSVTVTVPNDRGDGHT